MFFKREARAHLSCFSSEHTQGCECEIGGRAFHQPHVRHQLTVSQTLLLLMDDQILRHPIENPSPLSQVQTLEGERGISQICLPGSFHRKTYNCSAGIYYAEFSREWKDVKKYSDELHIRP